MLVAGWIAIMALVAMVAVLVTAYFSGGDESRPPVAANRAPPTVAEQASDSKQAQLEADASGESDKEPADSGTVVKSSPDIRIESASIGD